MMNYYPDGEKSALINTNDDMSPLQQLSKQSGPSWPFGSRRNKSELYPAASADNLVQTWTQCTSVKSKVSEKTWPRATVFALRGFWKSPGALVAQGDEPALSSSAKKKGKQLAQTALWRYCQDFSTAESGFWRQHVSQPAGKFSLQLAWLVSAFVLHTGAISNSQECSFWS